MTTERSSSDAIAAITASRSQSLTKIVYKELEHRILSGEMKAGERLNEQSLAQALGVSRGPIREARRSLEQAGFVVSIPGKGTFVRKVDEAELAENYDIRALLTGFACAMVAKSGSDRDKATLQSLVSQMQEASRAADDKRYYALNVQFHEKLMKIAGHRRAEQIYQAHVKETHLSRHLSLTQRVKMEESNAEHAAILNAIVAGDPEQARK